MADLFRQADRLEAVTEFLTEAQQILHLWADSCSWLLRIAPSEITVPSAGIEHELAMNEKKKR